MTRERRRLQRVWPGEFRNNFGNYLADISLAHKAFVLFKNGKRMCVFSPVERDATGERITPSQYRKHASEYIARVRWAKERFIIMKRDRKLAWMRPVEDLEIAVTAPKL